MNSTLRPTEEIEFEVNSLYERLLKLKDKRAARGKRYRLAVALTWVVLARLGGEDKPEGIAEGVKHRADMLREALRLKRSAMPPAVTYRRVLGTAVNVEEFEQAVGAFFRLCAEDEEA